jgi:cytochrome b6-f complex iron-sulfur subunit
MERRRFLSNLLKLLGLTSLASFIYPIVRFLSLPRAGAAAKGLEIAKKDVPLGQSKQIIYQNKPAIIINIRGKGFIALSRVCTHLGCLVDYNKEKNILLCPCHGGAYNLNGNVISGPPPKPLQKFPLRVEGEQILIG